VSKLPVAGFVLAGGKSSRMGRDKALLELDGRPLVERAMRLLGAVCMEASIAGGSEELARFGRVVPDGRTGCGPLSGIVAALEASGFDWNLMLAVDVPLVPVDLVRALAEQCAGSSAVAVVARVTGRPEPLCAAYHRRALPGLQSALNAGRFKVMTAIAESGSVEYFEVDGKKATWFTNVNTQEEFTEAMRLVQRDGI
jgi:molybdopterin-guanine dinucleotide biosynthesis protein A